MTKTRDFGRQVDLPQAEVEHASMGLALAEDQLSEVAVEGDDEPLLGSGEPQDLLVLKGLGVITGHRLDIVADFSKVGCEPDIGALVDQDLQA